MDETQSAIVLERMLTLSRSFEEYKRDTGKALDEFKTDAKEERAEMKCDLDEIKQQTAKTNGRVTSLELWQNRLIGALAVLVTLATLIGAPVVVALLT